MLFILSLELVLIIYIAEYWIYTIRLW